MADKTFEGWDTEEWAQVRTRLQNLSLEQLLRVLAEVNIPFNKRRPLAAEDIILVLDEADHEKLYSAIKRYQ